MTQLKKAHFMVAAKKLGFETEVINQYVAENGFFFKKIGGNETQKLIIEIRKKARERGWIKSKPAHMQTADIFCSPCGTYILEIQAYLSTEAKNNRYLIKITRNYAKA